MATSLEHVSAEQKSWQDVRDDFMQRNSEFVRFHCDRGKESNKKSISAFNDEWVSKIILLRAEAGVATDQIESSSLFFAGLSMAMKSLCPGVW